MVKTALFDGGLDFTSMNARQKAWKDFDPTAEWSPTNKAWKIDIGGFKGGFWRTLSRWTWELPQTLIGKTYSHYSNLSGNVESVDYWGGSTVIRTKGDYIPLTKYSLAATHGSFIIGNNTISADPINPLFQHEYGHYLQSKYAGWLYYSKYGIPSASSKRGKPHYLNPVEQDANVRAFLYFSKYVDGFNWQDEWGIQHSNWFRADNPIIDYNWALPFNNPSNQEVLIKKMITINWYDNMMLPLNLTIIGNLIPGFINSFIYNSQY